MIMQIKEDFPVRPLFFDLQMTVIFMPYSGYFLPGHLASFLRLVVSNPDGGFHLESDS